MTSDTQTLNKPQVTRKPCCRRESARCRCNFRSI